MLRHLQYQIRKCSSTTTTQQEFAKSVRQHLSALNIDTWKQSTAFNGWNNFFKVTKLNDHLTSSASKEQLTAMLSYPITLAWLMTRHPRLIAPTDKPLHIHILGARAEALFPDFIWQLQSDIFEARKQKNIHISLFGPMVIDLGNRNDRRIGNLRIKHYPNTLYHNTTTEKPADVFVAFQPGWGQPEWFDSWRPTLEKIMTVKRDALRLTLNDAKVPPLYFTSFDHSDMVDDVAFLSQVDVSLGDIWSKSVNPFQSLHSFPHSSNDSNRMIQVNNCVSGYQ